jgi:hypothetical protein
MLYSTIEEAWSKPTIIEGFKSESECLRECEKLISQISKCDGCMRHLEQLLGNQTNALDWVVKYFNNTDNVRTILLYITIFLFLFIVFS